MITRTIVCPSCAERARRRSDLGAALACFALAAALLAIMVVANDGTAGSLIEGWVQP